MIENKPLSHLLGDLEECNNEAIHLSGAVQGHGCLIIFSWPEKRIIATSLNTAKTLGVEKSHIDHGHIGYLFGAEATEEITHAINTDACLKGCNLHISINANVFDAFLYKIESFYAIELEPLADEEIFKTGFRATDQTLAHYMNDLKDSRSITESANKACAYIRQVTGIDRVMMYKFMPPAWHGEVIGEDRVMGSYSFMNHRFPSSDIPKPARDLYLKNKVRLIHGSTESISPIEPTINPVTGKKWDLSDSRLRSVAPIHLEYLRNMGVNGSMSFAIVINGELWGLIACHHMEDFQLSHQKRAIGCIMADAFASHVSLLELLDSYILKSAFDSKLRKLIEAVIHMKDPVDSLFKEHSTLMNIFSATGVALCSGPKMDFAGITPPRSLLSMIASEIKQSFKESGRTYMATQNINETFPAIGVDLSVSCGLLCIALGDDKDSLLMLFRPEVIEVVTWGGNPIKNLEKKNFSGRINPRKSFESWEEVIRNQSKPWASYKVDGALFLKEVVFEVVAQKNFLIDDLTKNKRKN